MASVRAGCDGAESQYCWNIWTKIRDRQDTGIQGYQFYLLDDMNCRRPMLSMGTNAPIAIVSGGDVRRSCLAVSTATPLSRVGVVVKGRDRMRRVRGPRRCGPGYVQDGLPRLRRERCAFSGGGMDSIGASAHPLSAEIDSFSREMSPIATDLVRSVASTHSAFALTHRGHGLSLSHCSITHV